MRKGDFEFRTPLHAYIPPLALSWCRVMTGKVDARRHERQKPTPDTEARRSRTNPGPGRGRNTIPPRPLLCRGNSMSSSLYRSVLTRRSVPCMYLYIRHAASHWRTRPEVHRRRRFTSLYVRVWVYASLEGDSSDGMRRKTPLPASGELFFYRVPEKIFGMPGAWWTFSRAGFCGISLVVGIMRKSWWKNNEGRTRLCFWVIDFDGERFFLW